MSGGHWEYKDGDLRLQIFGWEDKPSNVLGDIELSELLWDTLNLFAHKGRSINRERRHPDVLDFKKVPSRRMMHPTEKPVDLLELFILNSSDRGDLVIYPFMGSGTTAVACHNTGRRFMGIEIDDRYFNAAAARMWRCHS